MRIVLKRQISSVSYSVRMSVFISERRPELLPLLKAVQEAEEKKENSVKYMNKTLFQSFSEKFVINILEELKILDLIDSDYSLSPRGFEALEEETILTPDEGAFEIRTVKDVLLPQVIIDFKRLDPNLDRELKESLDGRTEKKIVLPNHVLKTEGTKLRTLEKRPRLVDIHEINKIGIVNRNSVVNLDILLTYSEGKWKSKVVIQNKEFSFPFPEGYEHKLLVDQLLKIISPNADLKRWRIPQNPSNLQLSEVNSFLKNFDKKSIKLGDLGNFSQVKFYDVSIFPDCQISAILWAKTIFLERKCFLYLVGNQYEIQWKEMLDEFSDLKDFKLDIPKRDELLDELEFGSQKYWFLKAPEDMLLEEVISFD